MRKGLKDIIDKVGVTSILVTHDQEEAFDLADQIVIFNRCNFRPSAYTLEWSQFSKPVSAWPYRDSYSLGQSL